MIRYEHPLNERIRTLMRLEDLYRARAVLRARRTTRRRITPRCSRCSRSPTSPRAPTSRPTSCRSSSGRSSCSSPLRSNPAIEARVLEHAARRHRRRRARSCSRQTGKVGAHLRDNEWLMTIKQRTGDSGRRLRSSICPPITTGCNADAGGAAAATSHGWIAPFAADPRRARDRPAPAARQRRARAGTPRIAACSS